MININYDIVLLGLARLVQSLIGLAALRLMTHYLTVSQFGLLGLMTALTGFFGLFLVNPVGQHVNRHTHDWHRRGILFKQLKRYNYYLVILSIIAFVIGGVWYGFHTNWTGTAVNQLGIAVVLSLSVWLATWNATLIFMLNMLGCRTETAALSVLTVAVGLAVSVLFIYWQSQAIFWLAGQLVGLACGAWLALRMLRRSEPLAAMSACPDFLDRATLRHYCLPLAAATGLMWLISCGYRFLVDAIWGAHDLGLLVLGVAVAAQFWAIIENVAGQIVYPKYYFCLSKDSSIDKQNAYGQMINVVIPIYLLLLGLGLATAPHLLAILADARFVDASQLCSIAMIIEAMRAITSVINQAAQIEKKTVSMINPYLIGVFATSVGFFFLYFLKAAVIWVPWVLVFSMMCVMVTAIYKMRKIALIIPDYKNWMLSLFMGLAVLLCTSLFSVESMLGHILVIAFSAIFCLCALFLGCKKNEAYHQLMAVRLPVERN